MSTVEWISFKFRFARIYWCIFIAQYRLWKSLCCKKSAKKFGRKYTHLHSSLSSDFGGAGGGQVKILNDSQFGAVSLLVFNTRTITVMYSLTTYCLIHLVVFEWALMTTHKKFGHAQWEFSRLDYWIGKFIKATDYRLFMIASSKCTVCKPCEVNQGHV